MAAKFEVKTRPNGQYMFNLKAANGEIILTSEQYKDRAAALNGIEAVKANAGEDARYERKVARDAQSFFVLKAANGQTIGISEMYTSPAALEKGIQSVKKNALEARVEEATTS